MSALVLRRSLLVRRALVRTAANAASPLLSPQQSLQQLVARSRPRSVTAVAAILGVGSLAPTLLWLPRDQQQTAQCSSAASVDRPADLVRSVADISAIEGKWRTIARVAWRCVELLCLLTPCLTTLPLLRTRLRARWLRLLVSTLERCGPVGIKWGQWASTRYDLFEDDLCDALGALTNAAPVHPMQWTRQLFRDELGTSVDELFEDFTAEPIASGSIGQVHTATLKAAHGPHKQGLKVAVKVQHPGLADRLGIDMAILMAAADAVGSVKGLRINETVAQFASNFYMQLDFRDEAQNLRRFATHFSSSFWRAIVSFPTPVDDLVSRHLVVETFEPGQSVADYLHKAGDSPKVTKWKREGDHWVPVDASLAMEVNRDGDDVELRKKVALCGVQSYLKMLMMDNFIHADLHPGNVLVRMEEVGWVARLQRYLLIGQSGERVPHIVFLDAGLAATFNEHIYGNVQGFFEAIVSYDGPRFAKAILGLAPSQPYVHSPQAFSDEVDVKMKEMRAQMLAGEGRAGDNIRSFMSSVRAHNVKLDPSVMVALMSMLVLEGWQFRLDPGTSVVGSIESQLSRRSTFIGWVVSIWR